MNHADIGPINTQESPKVMHLGNHPQPGGGFNDLMLRVSAREKLFVESSNYVYLIDSAPRCATIAQNQIESKVTELEVFGRASVSAFSIVSSFENLAGLPTLLKSVRSNSVDLIHANSFRAAIIGGIVATLSNTPFIFHVHHTSFYREHPFLSRLLFLISDRIIHVSNYTRRALSGNDEKHMIVRSPIDIDTFRQEASDPSTLLERFNIGSRPIVVLVGSLDPRKGHKEFISAAADVNADFVIVGSGNAEYRDELEGLINRLGLSSSVHFTGFWEDITEIYEAADVVVVPSQDENLPKVIQEALAYKTPIVASNSGGIPELVTHEETGLLISTEDDGTELANAVNRLLNEPSFAKELSNAGHERLRNEFDSPNVAKHIEEIYEAVL